MIREERPNTVDTFLQACYFCIVEMKYPKHWIASVIDELLRPVGLLKTRVILQNKVAPQVPNEEETRVQKYNVSAFQLDLQNQINLWFQCRLLPSTSILATNSFTPSNVSQYHLTLTGLGPLHFHASNLSAILGFLLEEEINPSFGVAGSAVGEDLNPMMMMALQMAGGAMAESRKRSSRLRKELLDNGDKVGHVFSCVKVDSFSESSSREWGDSHVKVSFWMSDDIFASYKSYHFSLIRTDAWYRLDHDTITLGDAQRE